MHVVPDTSQEQYITSQPACCNRLVGSLAAVGLHEPTFSDGLPRTGKSLDIDIHIYV